MVILVILMSITIVGQSIYYRYLKDLDWYSFVNSETANCDFLNIFTNP